MKVSNEFQCVIDHFNRVKSQVANGTYVAPVLSKTESHRFLDPISILNKGNKMS
jgi:hypothetical protein